MALAVPRRADKAEPDNDVNLERSLLREGKRPSSSETMIERHCCQLHTRDREDWQPSITCQFDNNESEDNVEMKNSLQHRR